MAFLSPLWLLALLPWALLAAWLLRGRRRRVKVPFLHLWRGPLPLETPRRGWRTPPMWLALVLLALLTALLAAAKPVVRSHYMAGAPLTIIVDRGMSMSATDDGKPRYIAVCERLAERMRQMPTPPRDVRLIAAPGDVTPSAGSNWLEKVRSLPPTALDTRDAVIASVHDELARSDRPVLLVSDQMIAIANPRFVQIGPTGAIENVVIVKLSARASPTPQVMVRVRNDGARKIAHLRVSSDQTSERAIELPPSGSEQNYFFDLPQLGQVIHAQLLERDDQPADDQAWLVRESSFARIEIRAALSPELRRMLEVYQRNRPPSAQSRIVAVVDSEAKLPSGSPGIIVSSALQPVRGSPNVAVHPVTRDVNWQAVADRAMAADAPGGFAPVVSIDGRPLVAVRSDPARQVWVGFDAGGWSASVDFVVFWANVLSWVGEGGQEYAGHPLSDFQQDWKWEEPPKLSPAPLAGQWPGVYKSSDGMRHALNAPVVQSHTITADGGLQRLLQILDSGQKGYAPLASLLILLAIGLIGASCWSWRSDVSVASNSLFS
jgi:hypothetical protein